MTARKRGRPTPPPPAGVRQVRISTTGITIIDDAGRCRWRWGELGALTRRTALEAYLSMGVGYTVVQTLYNKRGTAHTYVLQRRYQAVVDEEQAA